MKSVLFSLGKAGMVTAFGLALLIAVIPDQKKELTLSEESLIYPDKSGFCKNLIAKDVISTLNKAKDKQIILNLYPVKSSGSMEKYDFDVMYCFQDLHGKKLSGGKLDLNKLKSGTANYMQYLKNNNVPQSTIPFAYYIRLNSNHLKNAGAIELCFQVLEGKLKCYTLPQKPTYAKTTKASPDEDSIGKCPPDCYALKLFSIDSVGKCPPDCLTDLLVYQNTVQQIIKKVYAY